MACLAGQPGVRPQERRDAGGCAVQARMRYGLRVGWLVGTTFWVSCTYPDFHVAGHEVTRASDSGGKAAGGPGSGGTPLLAQSGGWGGAVPESGGNGTLPTGSGGSGEEPPGPVIGGEAGSGGSEGDCPPAHPPSTWTAWRVPNSPGSGLPNPASYTVLPDGTVQDNITGLIWQREVPSRQYFAEEARAYCESLRLGGCSGWRLPTRVELISLLDYATHSPAIDSSAFPGCPSQIFWTSSPYGDSSGRQRWVVNFGFGYHGYMNIYSLGYVRCVR